MRKLVVGAGVLLVLALIGVVTATAGAGPMELDDAAALLGASEKKAACSGPSADSACGAVRFEIMLANAGGPLHTVSVRDTLPAEVEYVPGSATGGLEYLPEKRTLSWLGSLRANSAVTLTFDAISVVRSPVSTTNEALICIGKLDESDCITRSVTVALAAGTVTPPTPLQTMTPSPTATSTITKPQTATPTWPAGSPTPTGTASATSETPTPTGTPIETVATPTATSTPTATAIVRRQFLPLILRVHPIPPAPTATATPSWPVSLDGIWLEGPRGTQNYEFRRCEVIYEWIQLTNHSDEPALVSFDWRVRDWSGRYIAALSYVNWQLWWPSGTYQANLPRAIPSNLGFGPYELTIKLWSAQGLVAERVAYFTITGDDPVAPPLAELQTCRGISGDGLPLDVTDRFSVDDPAAYVWAWWQRGGNAPHTVRWAWYAPDGAFYSDYEEEYVEPCAFYSWAWLEIAGTEVATMPGEWTLNAYFDEELVATRSFHIVDESGGGSSTGAATTGGGHLAGACGPPKPTGTLAAW